MATENYCNTFNVTLTSTVTTGTSLSVTTAAPIAGGFRILIDSELMLVTSGGTTTSWVVTRNIEGTTLASHVQGSMIVIVLSAGSLDALRAQWSSVGLYASLPATGMKKGDQYWCSDQQTTYIYNGSTWVSLSRGAASSGNLGTVLINTSESTNSTSYVDLATLDTITITLPSIANVLIEYKCGILNVSANYSAYNQLLIDGSSVYTLQLCGPYNNVFGTPMVSLTPYLATNLAAGSHIIKMQHKVDGGSGYTWSNRLLTAVYA